MYHRYQPSENGQFRRQTVPDSPPKSTSSSRTEQKPLSFQSTEHRPEHQSSTSQRRDHGQSAPSPVHTPTYRPPRQDADHTPPPRFQLPFLEKLLPNMDNGDLLLLLIMLLLISEGNEESSSVVMTLAIFLFLQ